ncbi:MAG TPA: hypothetical protein VFQ53_16525 [Kofleriaceae bacterium]|nr:hypothetical protein [Kofleriaceae bacterium]
MVDFIRAGGFSMLVLLALGAVLVITAIKFARNADAQRLSLIRALSNALVFASITGFVAGLASTAMYVVRNEPKDTLAVLLTGFAESTTNLILGGGLAFVTWILVAVGVRRMPRDPS